MLARLIILGIILIVAALAGCGRGVPSAPLTPCAETRANALTPVLTPAESLFDHNAGIPIVAVYACHGIIPKLTP